MRRTACTALLALAFLAPPALAQSYAQVKGMDERLRIEWRPFAEAVAAVERGEIRDAKSVAGILWVAYERARAGATAREHRE